MVGSRAKKNKLIRFVGEFSEFITKLIRFLFAEPNKYFQ